MYIFSSLLLYYFLLNYLYFFCLGNNIDNYLVKKKKNFRFYVPTRYGKTCIFYRKKKNTKKLLLMIPGFGSTLDTFEPYFNDFPDYDLLSLDFYGRGWTNGIDQKYDINLFINQIFDVLYYCIKCKEYQEINFIGCSMGCILTDEFIKKYQIYLNKIKINNIVYIAPAGDKIKKPFYSKLLNIRYLNRVLLSIFCPFFLYFHNKRCYNLTMDYRFLTYIYHHRGYVKGLLSTLSHVNLGDHIYDQKHNILVITSKDDRVIKNNFNKFSKCENHVFDIYGHCELIEPSKELIYNFLTTKN
jgi:pimeloyl-ACP methyl ester carboxylesterase